MRKQIVIGFSGLLCCASIQANEAAGIDALADVYYRFEVAAAYCGVVNDQAIAGYYVERGQIVEKFSLSKANQINASGIASQAAHKEWQNRGLGGFKPWCRTEGRAYADQFLQQLAPQPGQ